MQATTTSVLTPFIKVAEVWVPKEGKLVNAGGDYGTADAFAEASVKTSFSKGEGLPGKAWETQAPVVLKQFDGSYFKRVAEAADAGLTSAVAIPVFAGNELKAVLVILCGSDTDSKGALEVWQGTDGTLALADGFYGGATSFETASKGITFGFGQGLPGAVWAANTPILNRDVSRAGSFIRSGHAAESGFKTGLGLPVPLPGDNPCVVTLLCAPYTPIARRFEIWDARPECVGATRKAMLIDGLCEREGALWSQQNPPVDLPMANTWKGPIGQVLGTGLPFIQREGSGLPAGYESMFALPIYRESDLAYIVACYL